MGKIASGIMARSNTARIAWGISLMGLAPNQRVLEIGFGPGVGIQMLARQTPRGMVAGIDISELMLSVAEKRNQAAIQAGRVLLQQGRAEEIPFADMTFEHVFSSNSIHFWPDPIANLGEVLRVLKPGGMITTLLQPRWAKSDPQVREIAFDFAAKHQAAGFDQVRVEYKSTRPMMTFCILATRP